MKTTNQAVGIEYANARLRGARTKLLTSADIETLVNSTNLDVLIRSLSELPTYAQHMDDAALTSSGTRLVTLALRSRLGEVYSFVDSMLDNKNRRLIDLLVSIWDFRDLKTIVRGTTAGVTPEETIESIIGVGVHIAREDIMALAAQHDLEEVVQTAITLELPYASALSDAYKAYKSDGSLISLELELDAAWTKMVRKALPRFSFNKSTAVHKVLDFEIDLINLLTALRAGEARDAVEGFDQFFLDGGSSIDRELFHRLAQIEDPSAAMELLPNDPFANVKDAAAEAYVMYGRISAIERTIRTYATSKFVKEFGRDILGLGVAVSYLLAVENEVQNLRVIAYGTRFAMPKDSIRRELIGV